MCGWRRGAGQPEMRAAAEGLNFFCWPSSTLRPNFPSKKQNKENPKNHARHAPLPVRHALPGQVRVQWGLKCEPAWGTGGRRRAAPRRGVGRSARRTKGVVAAKPRRRMRGAGAAAPKLPSSTPRPPLLSLPACGLLPGCRVPGAWALVREISHAFFFTNKLNRPATRGPAGPRRAAPLQVRFCVSRAVPPAPACMRAVCVRPRGTRTKRGEPENAAGLAEAAPFSLLSPSPRRCVVTEGGSRERSKRPPVHQSSLLLPPHPSIHPKTQNPPGPRL
jgi:hypothetical protein